MSRNILEKIRILSPRKCKYFIWRIHAISSIEFYAVDSLVIFMDIFHLYLLYVNM